uniref:Chitin-binding type-2 domain-containing protein n=1 Tax=Panagrellus redivivus TaxID=6233 RepID=A0A7E4ZT35_PANRE
MHPSYLILNILLCSQLVNASDSILARRFKEVLKLADDVYLIPKHPNCYKNRTLPYVALGPCRSTFLDCTEVNSRKACLFPGHVFSEVEQRCKSKLVSPECSYSHETRLKSHRTLNQFCRLRPNGKFRHPNHCGRIIHCFDDIMIEIEPCGDGLAFDEYLKKCVYAQFVPGCDVNVVSKCNPWDTMQADCHGYERCFAGQLIRMHCDSGLAYNAVSMVCDYEKNVPSCVTK